jgi:hypothetical protein
MVVSMLVMLLSIGGHWLPNATTSGNRVAKLALPCPEPGASAAAAVQASSRHVGAKARDHVGTLGRARERPERKGQHDQRHADDGQRNDCPPMGPARLDARARHGVTEPAGPGAGGATC